MWKMLTILNVVLPNNAFFLSGSSFSISNIYLIFLLQMAPRKPVVLTQHNNRIGYFLKEEKFEECSNFSHTVQITGPNA